MAIDRTPVLKRCRSLGLAPAFMGISKESKRQVRRQNRKKSEYGIQLTEKQKLNLSMAYWKNNSVATMIKLKRWKASPVKTRFILRKRRIDNVVFRLGLANTRRQARQIVRHGHIAVNGKRLDIPSALVRVEDVVTVMENSRAKEYFTHGRNSGYQSSSGLAGTGRC